MRAEDFVHKGSMWAKNHKNDKSRCEFSVAEFGRLTDWHQCYRKPVEYIDGIGFCKLHAEKVRSKLGISETNLIRFAASFVYGSPKIVKLEVVSETDKTINIKSTEEIFGQGHYLFPGITRKDSNYTKQWNFFDTYEEAVLFLYKKSENNWRRAEKDLQEAVELMNKLASMVLEFQED